MGSIKPEQLGDFDVLVVGGGFCGVWQLHTLRNMEFRVRLVEAGAGLAGIWHWNAYPGARVDTPVPTYQLTDFDSWNTWDWKETFPSRDELVEYFRHLDKVWDLSKDVNYQTRVTAMRWDSGKARWSCTMNDGEAECTAWTVVLCTGFASKRYIPPLRNLDTFEGEMHHTGVWPQEGVSLKGRRVGIIGTGASGVQLIQEVAKEAAQLTVFQRTPNTALMMTNPGVDNGKVKEGFPEVIKKMEKTFAGFDYEFLAVEKHPMSLSKEERLSTFEELYHTGGLHFWLGTYMDVLFHEELNEEAYQFWRSKTIPRIQDTRTAEILAPKAKVHPFGTKRISLEKGYFECFNQENVDLVDMRAVEIEEFVSDGIRTSDGRVRKFDLICLATGFDAVTGGITQIDIQNPQGVSIKDRWANGTLTNFGMTTSGFPNLFFTYGPQAPTAFATGPSSAEVQGRWISEALRYLRNNGYRTIDATPESEQEWRAHVNEVANKSLFPQAESWYFGGNIPGKQKEALNYMGGLPEFKRRIWASADNGYAGFLLSS